MKRSTVSILILSALTGLAALPAAAESITDLNGVAVNNAKIPFYNQGALQSMIFADKAEYRAQLLYGHDVVINMLQKKVDPDRIRNDWKLELYPLGADLKSVTTFWLPRLNYCDAVIFSPEGVLNQAEHTAAGDKLVRMRSPLLDLDGVGFAADFKRRQIKVNSDVRLVLRSAASDPRVFGSRIPAEYEFIRGRADMLHLDTARNRVMLLGKVEIRDEKVRLTCDRLTLHLGEDKARRETSSMSFSGIRALYADGSVKVEKVLAPDASPSEKREVHGDHLVYDVPAEQLTVTGDRKPPYIVSGNGLMLRGKRLVYFRPRRQLIIPAECWMRLEQNGVRRYLRSDYGNLNFGSGICDFLENVRGSAPQHELACDKMRIILRRTTPERAAQPAADKLSPLSGAADFDSGSMEFEKALCKGRVQLFRKEQNGGTATLASRTGELNYLTDQAVFTGQVIAKSDGNTLETEKLILHLKKAAGSTHNRELKSAEAVSGVKISGTPAGNNEKSVITSDRGFFDYKSDKIDFTGNVKAGRGDSTLTGDKLELFLAPRETKDQPVALPGVTAGSGRTLRKATASGNAVMDDGRNKLYGDRIDYFFIPAPHDAPPQPGIFQSGSLRLSKVICDGNVLLTSRRQEPVVSPAGAGAAAAAPEAPGAGTLLGRNSKFREIRSARLETDMLAHTSIFTKNVSMTDGTSKLDCEKLELFAKKAPGVAFPAAGNKTPPPVDIDADPFDLPSENSVPSTVALGNGLELDRAVASDNVILDHRDSPGNTRKVYCDKAVFNSADMTVNCTGTPERRPRAEGSGKTHEAEKFVIHLKDERLESIGDTETR